MSDSPVRELKTLDELPVLPSMSDERWGTDFDALIADLYASTDARLMQMEDGSGAIAFRNSDLRALAADKRLGNLSAPLLLEALGVDSSNSECPEARLATSHIFTMNPPSHGPLRRVFERQFKPQTVSQFQDAAEWAVSEAVARAAQSTEINFGQEFARPLAASFWGSLLNLDQAVVDRLTVVVGTYGPAFHFERTPEEGAALTHTVDEYLAILIAGIENALSSEDPPAFLVEMAQEFAAAEVEKPDSVAKMLAAVLIDGFHTLPVTMTNVVRTLTQRSDVLASLKADPTLLDDAFFEAVRLAPAGVFTTRMALTDMDYDGVHLPAGTPVTMWWLAGNRDPEVFADPNTYDLTRDSWGSLTTFGGGVHLCPGRNLARFVIEAVITGLTAPGVHLTVTNSGTPVPWSGVLEFEDFTLRVELDGV